MKKDEIATTNETKMCAVCEKNTEAKKMIRVKIENNEGYGIVYDVCPVCVKENNYTEYDGSDVLSDWN